MAVEGQISGPRRASLRVRVHLEAFVGQPLAYLQAAIWRARGLRLRAYHRVSRLMGHSSKAYDLWIATREGERLSCIGQAPDDGERIHVLIDCRYGSMGMAETLASIERAADDRTDIVLLGHSGAASEALCNFPDLPAFAAWAQDQALLHRVPFHWTISIRPGDCLNRHAIAAYRVSRTRAPQARVHYADDDLLDARGMRHSPHFKPDWNEALARHLDYLTNSCLFANDPYRIDGQWPRSAIESKGIDPIHVPHVLHHRVERPKPSLPGPISPSEPAPKVSIIIPIRDRAELLRNCIMGVERTNYPSIDVTVIDNGSTEARTLNLLDELRDKGVKIRRIDGEFNYAAMHNAVIPTVDGHMICLLNNDIEVLSEDWLKIMVASAQQEGIGAVGARLLYPDRTIQHAGIVLGVGGGAGHAHRYQDDRSPGYFGRAHLPQYVSAVTAACMVLRKDHFLSVGGFDEENFAVAFNDVDLCLKLQARGLRNFYEPRACLIHHESKSRGNDQSGAKKARFAGELAALKRIWATDQGIDPYHHSELSPFSEQFVLRL